MERRQKLKAAQRTAMIATSEERHRAERNSIARRSAKILEQTKTQMEQDKEQAVVRA